METISFPVLFIPTKHDIRKQHRLNVLLTRTPTKTGKNLQDLQYPILAFHDKTLHN